MNMKFLVFSDSHKFTNGMDAAIEQHKDINHIIHCGDMSADVEYLQMVYGTSHAICAVCGNNDFSAAEPYLKQFSVAGHRIYVTHGHKERVKQGLQLLEVQARKCGADICVFGHTHAQYYETRNGIIFLNPGSIGYFRQEYAVLDVTKESVSVTLYSL